MVWSSIRCKTPAVGRSGLLETGWAGEHKAGSAVSGLASDGFGGKPPLNDAE